MFISQSCVSLVLTWCLVSSLQAQQIPDTTFHPEIRKPKYSTDAAPLILIDEAHHNFHTRPGRYRPFADLLVRDGYRVESLSESLSLANLRDCRILVIANALHPSDLEEWVLPNPSAFTAREIEILAQWVTHGGSLFLIADHMPFAGAASELAAVFGVDFLNGFAVKTKNPSPDIFSLKSGSLTRHFPVKGNSRYHRVDSIITFTGQGFQAPPGAISLLNFSGDYEMLLPDTAWVFHEKTKTLPLEGLSQLAIIEHGRGRVVISGEAAMFTAQLAGPEQHKIGMNAPAARFNAPFLLNLIHWLDE